MHTILPMLSCFKSTDHSLCNILNYSSIYHIMVHLMRLGYTIERGSFTLKSRTLAGWSTSSALLGSSPDVQTLNTQNPCLLIPPYMSSQFQRGNSASPTCFTTAMFDGLTPTSLGGPCSCDVHTCIFTQVSGIRHTVMPGHPTQRRRGDSGCHFTLLLLVTAIHLQGEQAVQEAVQKYAVPEGCPSGHLSIPRMA